MQVVERKASRLPSPPLEQVQGLYGVSKCLLSDLGELTYETPWRTDSNDMLLPVWCEELLILHRSHEECDKRGAQELSKRCQDRRKARDQGRGTRWLLFSACKYLACNAVAVLECGKLVSPDNRDLARPLAYIYTAQTVIKLSSASHSPLNLWQ